MDLVICSDWEDWREDTDPAVCLFCDNTDSAEQIISHLKVWHTNTILNP